MTIDEFISRARRLHIRIAVDGDRVRLERRGGDVPAALNEKARRHRPRRLSRRCLTCMSRNGGPSSTSGRRSPSMTAGCRARRRRPLPSRHVLSNGWTVIPTGICPAAVRIAGMAATWCPLGSVTQAPCFTPIAGTNGTTGAGGWPPVPLHPSACHRLTGRGCGNDGPPDATRKG